MGYQTTTIDSIIDDVNYTYLVPAIQREFVWDSDQILDLFDSVVRGYPIGSFLFWRVSGEFSKSRIKYKFIKNYIGDPIHPDELDNVTYHNNRHRDSLEDNPNKINLVLDGQQRLTSFYIGLKGSYTEKILNKRRRKKDSWERKYLYLNIASPTDEEVSGRKFDFRFKKPDPDHGCDEYWYRVGDILDVDDFAEEADKIMENIESIDGINAERVHRSISKNIQRLNHAICQRESISYFEEDEENQEKILDIFIRANDGGTQLSKSDMLLSVATAQWSDRGVDNKVVAREEIKQFVDKLNSHAARGTVELDSNFVLRALLTASDVPNLSFTLANFDEETLREMKETWMDGEFKQAVMSTLDLLQSYGLSTTHIRSKMVILPIVYYFYHNSNPHLSFNGNSGRSERQKILYWMCSLVANGDLNTGGTIQTIRGIRNIIRESADREFPLSRIEEKLNDYNKSMGFDRSTLERWFSDGTLSNSSQRVVLSLAYFPDIASESYEYELDHIFPKSELQRDTLVDEYNMSIEKAERLDDLRLSTGNLQLIRAGENRSKSDSQLTEWLSTRREDYLDRHYVPTDEDLWRVENALDFINEREERLMQELLDKSPDRATKQPT